MKKVERLKKASDALYAARDKFEAAVAKALPEGASIRWLRGSSASIQSGHVIWAEGERIKVRNAVTYREYVIDLYDVFKAYQHARKEAGL